MADRGTGGDARSDAVGTGRSEREAELEREVKLLRETVTDSAIAQALLKRALEEERKGRPTVPARSWR